MSLEDLIGQDTMTISRSTLLTKDTSGGMVRLPLSVIFTDVPVRVEVLTTSQIMAYAQREVIVSHTLFTQQQGILNGDTATLSTGEVLRLALGFTNNRAMGTLDTFYEILGQQVGQVGDGVVTFIVTAPRSADIGVPFSFTVEAVDGSGDVVTDYTGTVQFSSTDLLATLPGLAMLVNGMGTFLATLETDGYQTITAQDTISAMLSGTSQEIVVGIVPGDYYVTEDSLSYYVTEDLSSYYVASV